MLFDQGKLEKMRIVAFKGNPKLEDVPELSTDEADIYEVQVNPASYSLGQTIDYTTKKGQGTSASDAVYNKSPARTVNFTFVFDGTGVVPPAPSPVSGVPVAGAIASLLSADTPFDVSDQIKKFNHVVYDYDGKLHRPRKVRLVWGTLVFDCALTSLSYDYKLFSPDGSPLRAMANCSFRESKTEMQRVLAEAPSSPDLTHLRRIAEGDRLPLLAQEVYGDPRHYIEVARHNKQINFRQMAAGTRISLPPLASTAGGDG